MNGNALLLQLTESTHAEDEVKSRTILIAVQYK